MNDERDMELDDVVELIDEDGKAVHFTHLMTLTHEDADYVLLTPAEPMEDVGEDEVIILKIEQNEDGDDTYAGVEDEALLETIFNKYLEIAEADDDEN